MERLHEIPWHQLTHAYGTAEDVPELLEALQTSPANDSEEDSPLWCLYGNIWHQGTVYEATSYAVPFLVDLATDREVNHREGILQLLADIANGSSYLAVHGHHIEPADFESKKQQELLYVANARQAVRVGVRILLPVMNEGASIGIAAAHVAAQFPEDVESVGPRLRSLFDRESDTLRRAGLILLLGQVRDQSEEAQLILAGAAIDENTVIRRAAAITLAKLPIPMTPEAGEAIQEAILDEELELRFDGLPWDAASDVDVEELISRLDSAQIGRIVEILTERVESGDPAVADVDNLIDLLFPRESDQLVRSITARDLSEVQRGAVRALVAVMETGKRIFYGHFPSWGLPDTMREWRNLAEGREPKVIDLTLPLLADPKDGTCEVVPSDLTVGQQILHRHFGLGVVTDIESMGDHIEINVLFEEEGTMTLGFAGS